MQRPHALTTLNQRVGGSSPPSPTILLNRLARGAIIRSSRSNHPATTTIACALRHLWQISGFATSHGALQSALRSLLRWPCLPQRLRDRVSIAPRCKRMFAHRAQLSARLQNTIERTACRSQAMGRSWAIAADRISRNVGDDWRDAVVVFATAGWQHSAECCYSLRDVPRSDVRTKRADAQWLLSGWKKTVLFAGDRKI
jgi:hypothetical protein